MAHQYRYWNTPGLHVQAGSQAANMHSLAMRIAGTTSGLHRRSGPSSTKRLPWRAAPNESRALGRSKELLDQRLAPVFISGAYIFHASTIGEKDKPNPKTAEFVNWFGFEKWWTFLHTSHFHQDARVWILLPLAQHLLRVRTCGACLFQPFQPIN